VRGTRGGTGSWLGLGAARLCQPGATHRGQTAAVGAEGRSGPGDVTGLVVTADRHVAEQSEKIEAEQ
jgi:hypothetical protein